MQFRRRRDATKATLRIHSDGSQTSLTQHHNANLECEEMRHPRWGVGIYIRLGIRGAAKNGGRISPLEPGGQLPQAMMTSFLTFDCKNTSIAP